MGLASPGLGLQVATNHLPLLAGPSSIRRGKAHPKAQTNRLTNLQLERELAVEHQSLGAGGLTRANSYGLRLPTTTPDA